MKKSYLVTRGIGKDELYCNWYVCPKCDKSIIKGGFKFCPDCGVAITFPEDIKTIEGYER